MRNSLPGWRTLRALAIEYGLDCHGVFDILDDETIGSEFNYFGPDRWPRWMRLKISKWHEYALPAVLVHDLDYVVGGNEDDFHAANRRLRSNLKKCLALNGEGMTWAKRLHEKIDIGFAYCVCELFGKCGFNFK